MSDRPWDAGDGDQNWQGYFIPGTDVLRNRVGARTAEALGKAEDALVELRVFELRESPELIGHRAYDLAHIRAIHKYLFQDVYDWAGETRTVGIKKENESFCPPGDVGRPMAHVAEQIQSSRQLRAVSDADLVNQIAYLYDYVNFAHPFREGNGRATREFFDQLLSERGVGLDWTKMSRSELYRGCHDARTNGDRSGLKAMFERILDHEPAYDF